MYWDYYLFWWHLADIFIHAFNVRFVSVHAFLGNQSHGVGITSTMFSFLCHTGTLWFYWDTLKKKKNNEMQCTTKDVHLIITVIINLLNNINIHYWLQFLVCRIFLNKCILLFSLDALNWSKITIKIFVMISISNKCSSLKFFILQRILKKNSMDSTEILSITTVSNIDYSNNKSAY